MTFGLLKNLVNASVLNHLADAQVLIGGTTVPGMFRNPSSVVNLGNGMADTQPSVTVASSAVPADPAEQRIEVDGMPYTILDDAPDGTGLTRLTLECTA